MKSAFKRPEYDFPSGDDPSPEYRKKKIALMSRILPVSVIPLSTSNAFLVLGSRGEKSCTGHPMIPTFLLWAGTISLAIGVMAVTAKYVVQTILSDRRVAPGEARLIWFLEHLGVFMSLTQAILLVSGTAVVLPLYTSLHEWQHDMPDEPNYCEHGMVLFSAIFVSNMWVLLVLTFVAYMVIKCV